jgi:hypothetical protein
MRDSSPLPSDSDHKLKLVRNNIKKGKINEIHKISKNSKMFMSEIPVHTIIGKSRNHSK